MSRIHFAAIEGFEAIDAVFADFLERLSGRPLALGQQGNRPLPRSTAVQPE